MYHVFNRGVEKRDVFLDDKDYARMLHDLFEFNNQNPAFNLAYHTNHQSSEVGLPKILTLHTLLMQTTCRHRMSTG